MWSQVILYINYCFVFGIGEKQSIVKGHHAYTDLWTPSTGEQLLLQSENNKYNVAVMKDN